MEETEGLRESVLSSEGGGIPEDLSVAADAGVASACFVMPVITRSVRGLTGPLEGVSDAAVAGVSGCELMTEGVSTISDAMSGAFASGCDC